MSTPAGWHIWRASLKLGTCLQASPQPSACRSVPSKACTRRSACSVGEWLPSAGLREPPHTFLPPTPRPRSDIYPSHLNTYGYNAIVLSSVSNCWVRGVSPSPTLTPDL